MKLESLKDVKFQEMTQNQMKNVNGGKQVDYSWGPLGHTGNCTTGYHTYFLGVLIGDGHKTDEGDALLANSYFGK